MLFTKRIIECWYNFIIYNIGCIADYLFACHFRILRLTIVTTFLDKNKQKVDTFLLKRSFVITINMRLR